MKIAFAEGPKSSGIAARARPQAAQHNSEQPAESASVHGRPVRMVP